MQSAFSPIATIGKTFPSLWDHQKRAVPFLAHNNEFALFWEPGCGKTAAMINGLRYIYTQSNRIQRTLIFAPLIVLHNWKKEFKMHSNINQRSIIVLDQSGKKRAEEFEKRCTLDPNFIAITNYEAVQMAPLLRSILQWNPEIMVCDESHRLKNHKSKRAKNVLHISRNTKRRYLLTGTPVLNSALDIFMQYQILERSTGMFGNNFYVFRGMYFEDVNAPWKHKHNYFPKWEPRATAHKELNEKIYRKAMRAIKSECLDLPPLVRQTIDSPMSPVQTKLYNQMKKDFIAFLDTQHGQKKAIVAQLALTKALRLQQICSGFAKTEDEKEIPFENLPRISVLSELLSDLTPGHKVIVWAVFKQNYKMIAKACDKLKLRYGFITGDTSTKERLAALESFEKEDDHRVMICNQNAGGIGINLTSASYSIFYSRNFSLEADIQAEARNYRGGSNIHKKITRIDLVAPGTIDELVLASLANKKKISDEILQWRNLL